MANFSSYAAFEAPLDKPPAKKPTLGERRAAKKATDHAKKKGGKMAKKGAASQKDFVVHIILDARSRKAYPTAYVQPKQSVQLRRSDWAAVWTVQC